MTRSPVRSKEHLTCRSCGMAYQLQGEFRTLKNPFYYYIPDRIPVRRDSPEYTCYLELIEKKITVREATKIVNKFKVNWHRRRLFVCAFREIKRELGKVNNLTLMELETQCRDFRKKTSTLYAINKKQIFEREEFLKTLQYLPEDKRKAHVLPDYHIFVELNHHIKDQWEMLQQVECVHCKNTGCIAVVNGNDSCPRCGKSKLKTIRRQGK